MLGTTVQSEDQTPLQVNLTPYRNARRTTVLIVVFIFVAMILYSNLTNSGTITMQISDESIGVAGANGTYAIIPYEDISSVELVSDFSVGTAIDAVDSSDNYEGTYENDLLGEYLICAYQKCSTMIVIYYNDDDIFVFNSSTAKATTKNYNSLLEKVQQQ